jgi:hypothetical protein
LLIGCVGGVFSGQSREVFSFAEASTNLVGLLDCIDNDDPESDSR